MVDLHSLTTVYTGSIIRDITMGDKKIRFCQFLITVFRLDVKFVYINNSSSGEKFCHIFFSTEESLQYNRYEIIRFVRGTIPRNRALLYSRQCIPVS